MTIDFARHCDPLSSLLATEVDVHTHVHVHASVSHTVHSVPLSTEEHKLYFWESRKFLFHIHVHVCTCMCHKIHISKYIIYLQVIHSSFWFPSLPSSLQLLDLLMAIK